MGKPKPAPSSTRPLLDELKRTCNIKNFTPSPEPTGPEPHIKKAVLCFFDELEYEVDPSPDKGKGGYDIICRLLEENGLARWWIIEVKGTEGEKSTNFLTRLGQLLMARQNIQGRTDIQISYGYALPDEPYYTQRCETLRNSSDALLHWHWFFVNTAGTVRALEPGTCNCLQERQQALAQRGKTT